MSEPITTTEVEVTYQFRKADAYGRSLEIHEHNNEQDAQAHLLKEYEWLNSEEFRQKMMFVLDDPSYVYDKSHALAVVKVTTTTTTEVLATA